MMIGIRLPPDIVEMVDRRRDLLRKTGVNYTRSDVIRSALIESFSEESGSRARKQGSKPRRRVETRD